MAATTLQAPPADRRTNADAAAASSHDADMDAAEDDPSSSSRKRKKTVRKDDAGAGPTAAAEAGESGAGGTAAKKKQAISCDACRARKVKCHRDEALPEGFDVKGPNVPQCQHCASLEINCTYAYVPKKRGPPNQYLKRLQLEQQKLADANGSPLTKTENHAAGPSRLGGSAAGSGESSLSPALAGPGAIAAGAPVMSFKLEQDTALSPPYGPNGGSGGGVSGSSWLSPPPGGADAASSLYSYPHPPRHFSSFSTTSFGNGGSAIGSSTFNALTLPPIEPSPPVSPFAIVSSSAMRPTLPSRSSTSLSNAYDGGARPNLPSLVRTSEFGSPGDTSSGGGGGSGATHAVDLGSPAYGGSPHGHSPSFIGDAAPSPAYGGVGRSPSFTAPSPNGGGPAGLQSALSPAGASPPLHLAPGGAGTHGYHPLVSDERSATVSHWMEATSLLESQQRNDSGGPSGRSASAPGLGGGGPTRGGSIDGGKSEAESPSLSLYSDGTSRRHRIEDVLPRDIAIYVISLFFDFVWVLTPALHKPTFLADLANRREETDPLFYALVMSTLASTLLQVPKVQIPVPAEEVRPLASKCFRASRSVSQHFYDPPAFSMVIIRYFDTIYHYVMGNTGSNTTSYVEALEIAIQLGLNNESVYANFNPIEREMARRIFFLLFDADKSMACLLGRVISLRREDITAVALPLEVDDECLTRDCILPQPPGKTPLIVGFNLSTRTFALLGTIIETQRAVQRLPRPIEPSVIVSKLREIGGMFSTATSIISEAPPAFRPRLQLDSACNSPAAGWNEAAMEQLHDYFSNPTPNQIDAKDAYQVCQGNLHVTMAWVRFVLVGYREELLGLSGQPGTPSRTAAERMAASLEGSNDSREVIAVDLLNTLHSIPMQSLAVNGPSLVQKTRFVAATFLETPPSDSDEARARISSYLFEFLTVLSEIEKNFAE